MMTHLSLVIFLLISFIQPSIILQASPATLSSYGTISYPTGFVIQGATLSAGHLHEGCINYVPNAFEIIEDLRINTIRIYGAGFSDWSMVHNPDTWDKSLDNFLALCSSHGLKVVFQEVGRTSSNPMFGIYPGEDIALSKSKVDRLAGNNNLGKNFLTDPRIALWILVNEPNLGDTNLLNWCREIGAYFKTKGAKVSAVGFADVNGDSRLQTWVPLIRDSSTHLVIHKYFAWQAQDAQDSGANIFDTIYPLFKAILEDFKSIRGDIPLQNLIIGEVGLPRGEFRWTGGRITNFTEETRGPYYRAVFQACKDAGIEAVFPYQLFDHRTPSRLETWGAVSLYGTYFIEVTDQYKAYYSTPRM